MQPSVPVGAPHRDKRVDGRRVERPGAAVVRPPDHRGAHVEAAAARRFRDANGVRGAGQAQAVHLRRVADSHLTQVRWPSLIFHLTRHLTKLLVDS